MGYDQAIENFNINITSMIPKNIKRSLENEELSFPSLLTSTSAKLCMYTIGCNCDDDCISGNICKRFFSSGSSFTQCLQDPKYADKAFLGRSCYNTQNVLYAQWGCQFNADCCNPFASCINGFCLLQEDCVWPKCDSNVVPSVQPTIVPSIMINEAPTILRSQEPSSLFLVPKLTEAASVSASVVVPTSSPTVVKMCMYATGCVTSDDCIDGNICKYFFTGSAFTQCLQNPLYANRTMVGRSCYNTQNVLYAQWGCQASSECCNPYAVCINRFCLLAQNCVGYRPTYMSYTPSVQSTALKTASPTAIPNTFPSFSPTKYPSRLPFSSLPPRNAVLSFPPSIPATV